ncbi:TerD family protein [Sphingomonas sp. 3-13AW]|uniref:TerD family protein n=1 Tax=Sphingomonas sp. 3-13AW TaxID=3050450 RepID=UPI003BB6C766
MGVSLKKGERVSLSKDVDAGLKSVQFGLGWDERKKGGLMSALFGGGGGGGIDLDASAVLFGANGSRIDQVWFRQLRSKDGSIVHSGDNLTGAGDGDDEVITVDLSRLPSDVQTIIFVVSSFRGDTFDSIDNAYARAVDAKTGREIARYEISGGGSHTGLIMASLSRKSGSWEVQAIGEPGRSRVFEDLLPQMQGHL